MICVKHTKTAYGYLLLIEEGEKVQESLYAFCERKKITSGVFSGIGAVCNAELGFFSVEEKKYETQAYDEQMEVASLTGNISAGDKNIIIHAHVALSERGFTLMGGHLVEADARPMVEIAIMVDDTPIKRTFNEQYGVYMLDL